MDNLNVPVPPASSDSEDKDTIISNLLQYCTEHEIWISPKIAIRRIPGRGLGVYATKPLRAGERIMQVPTAALFSTSSVPPSFVSKEARKGIPVHALLAAYLAFGLSETKRDEYVRWMATWPKLTDFTGTMPLLWPEALEQPMTMATATRLGENGISTSSSSATGGLQRETDSVDKFLPLPPSLTGSWLWLHQQQGKAAKENCEKTTAAAVTTTKLLDIQKRKFQSHLQIIAQTFPTLAPALLSPHDPLHWRFVHMWCNVNSRCFYYLRPGQSPPKDSNEAMAMCPGMDLFNHSDDPTCRTTYDRKGYEVSTLQPLSAGEEILLGYGVHNNDVLWAEYGFVMDDNADDGVQLDEIVLASLTAEQRKTLKNAGYLGDYWVKSDGLCWRTEAVSWLDVLTTSQWLRFIEGKYDPAVADERFALELAGTGDRNETKTGTRKRKRGSNGSIRTTDEVNTVTNDVGTPSQRAKRKQIAWIRATVEMAENSLLGLLSIVTEKGDFQVTGDKSSTELLQRFGDEDAVLEVQNLGGPSIPEVKTSQAALRHRMCVQRWRQILRLCNDVMTTIRESDPALQDQTTTKGAVNSPGASQDVEAMVDDFLRETGR
ncbi:hypothetical protein HRR83_005486 [Exophiala dermatitidis]|uniref:SET domain-containing protein n=1 Tax=Exophiala dermatitidis TaxID=5970 RepID=A0AAN6IUL6_EXODE|nr:hypothetical protein HRR75_004894 [Exophiala dermatitidis]KAJ4516182.1 hypothetical protein HRR74_005339 [Exophiala dermatitidis]KAJ4518412.1 hypothetical protein HRR73_003993 [Exophiala dermatitidis]KAJ4533906.1 hypothetical protein HRR76_005857 [Exophiala dermatitidis]KAJ4550062.1 hypothetical protein HRR77_003543 [Exophiala dermatitidis]